jgi:hypothetical protein
MLAGHVGAALMLGRWERRAPIAAVVGASLWMDMLLWSLVLFGAEFVTIPADFSVTHQANFVFPYSHSLVASLAWSVAAAFLAYTMTRTASARWRLAMLMAAAVFCHWLLDVLVHVPELPLAGAGSRLFGLGLWQTLPWALTVEVLIVAGGMGLYLPRASLPRARKIGLALLCLGVTTVTLLGMTVAAPPPSADAMAGGALAMDLLVVALVAWLAHAARVSGESDAPG